MMNRKLYFLILACWLAVAAGAWAVMSDPAQIQTEAYVNLVQGDQSYEAGRLDEALPLYEAARNYYGQLSQEFPSYQSRVVRYRSTYCDNQIADIERQLGGTPAPAVPQPAHEEYRPEPIVETAPAAAVKDEETAVEISYLKEKVSSLENQLSELEGIREDRDLLQDDNDLLTAELQDLRQKMLRQAGQQSEAETLKTDLETRDKELKTAQQDLAAREKKLAARDEEIQKLRRDLDAKKELDLALNDLESQVNSLQKEIKRQTAEIQTLDKELDDAEARAEKAESDLKKNNDLQKELKKAETDLKKSEKRASRLEKEETARKEAEDRAEQAETELKDAQSRLDDLENELAFHKRQPVPEKKPAKTEKKAASSSRKENQTAKKSESGSAVENTPQETTPAPFMATVPPKPVPENMAAADYVRQLLQDGENDAALATVQEARKSQPADVNLIMLEGISLIRLQRYEEAATMMINLAKNNPHNAEVHATLGAAMMGAGFYDEAREALLMAIKLDRNLPECQYNLAQLYAFIDPISIRQARKYYKQARELGVPEDPQLEKALK